MGGLLQRAQRVTQNLWTLIAPPTIWAVHFLFSYIYAAIRCAKSGPYASIEDVRLAIGIATIVALSLVSASGYIAWAHSKLPGDPPPHEQSTDEDRQRFVAVAKLLLAALSFIAIVYTAIPAFIFRDCR